MFCYLQCARSSLKFKHMSKLARFIVPYFDVTVLVATRHHSIFLTELEQTDLMTGATVGLSDAFPWPLFLKPALGPYIDISIFGDSCEEAIGHV